MSEAQRVGLGQRQQPRSFPSHISRLMHFTCIFTKVGPIPHSTCTHATMASLVQHACLKR